MVVSKSDIQHGALPCVNGILINCWWDDVVVKSGTTEISSTTNGAGFIPAEYHSVGAYNSKDESGSTVMITPTN